MPAPYPPDCWACADKIAWEVARGNWHKIPGHPGYYMEHDHTRMSPFTGPGWVPTPRDVSLATFALSSTCQRVHFPGKQVIYEPENGWFGNVCHRQQPLPCPSPSPSPGPTPPPGPGVNDIPARCPSMDAIHINVHNAMNSAFQTVPEPVAGGYVVIDSTPQFGCGGPTCLSRNRCNDEKHWICTISGQPHETQDSEHLAAAAADRACNNYRKCENPNGYCWSSSGPAGTPGGPQNNNFQYRLGPLKSGTYTVHVEACGGNVDHYGQPVPGNGVGNLTFTVP